MNLEISRPVAHLWVAGVLALLLTAFGYPATSTPTPIPSPRAGDPIPTGDAPIDLAVVDGDLLVVHNYDRTVVRVEADGSTTLLASGPHAGSLLAFGSLWVISQPESSLGAVLRLDPHTGSVQAQFPLPSPEIALAATESHLWALGEVGGGPGWRLRLWRIDPASDDVTEFPDLVQGVPGSLVFDGERLWAVSNCEEIPCQADVPRLTAIDPGSGSVIEQKFTLRTDQVASSSMIDGAHWLMAFTHPWLPDGPATLSALDRNGDVTASFDLALRYPGGIAGDSQGIWVSDCLAGTVSKFDLASGALVAGPVSVGTPYLADGEIDPYREDYSCPGALALAGDTLWVALWHDDAVVPVRPVR